MTGRRQVWRGQVCARGRPVAACQDCCSRLQWVELDVQNWFLGGGLCSGLEWRLSGGNAAGLEWHISLPRHVLFRQNCLLSSFHLAGKRRGRISSNKCKRGEVKVDVRELKWRRQGM
jgi:hypothetical protein